ncbi:MAG: bifunctional demethylmenaquinone methyltransferase/2-methoxy-6-polyprenyl-1,4-benzoquinol methylase UbiE [Saprospiraceae bacterium]|jgi:demethylmenaquinone methyltransferase/2-methoxy-6-polyprenyl-1,4-benzoquinol methylase|nr:bifunctional demethylmenaquinone methyltransferase/2-methoxy-6-polyprenyl-1,4-benzoquinol methylase UbiE [Saprospiraceae bacterium]
MPDHKPVTPYSDTDVSKKGQVTRMFDKIAPYYDNLNRILSFGIDILWRRKAIKMLAKENPLTILDIATGTGDLAIEAARVIKPIKITGMDISANMLKIGNEKIVKKGLTDVINMEIGDSENLKYETASYDAVMAAFGVRNFENLEKGLSEMFRVLKPGGTLLVLEFSKPRYFPLKQLFNLYFKNILPVIGKLRSKDDKAYKYLYESVQVFPDYHSFTDILIKLGYSKANFKVLSAGICCIYFAKK